VLKEPCCLSLISSFEAPHNGCPLVSIGKKSKVVIFVAQDLSLLDADGTPLPVEPGLPLGALQTKRCFVANSAVAPVWRLRKSEPNVFFWGWLPKRSVQGSGATCRLVFGLMVKSLDLYPHFVSLQLFCWMPAMSEDIFESYWHP